MTFIIILFFNIILKSFYNQKTLQYLSHLQNRNFSVLLLTWTKTIEMKQFFHGTYSNQATYLFYHKILKYFNDFQMEISQFED